MRRAGDRVPGSGLVDIGPQGGASAA